MRVLMSAYACEPRNGSEPGAGWNFARAAAERHEVCVLTRANNRERIDAELRANPVPGLRFEYVDLPAWARFWKRGRHGVRLYYSLWQLRAARELRRLCAREQFDVVHHVTFANAWLPALACLAPRPFVLGPVAGGQAVPNRLLPCLGVRGCLTELALRLRFLSRFNPLVRVAWHRAAVVLVNNDETIRRLPRSVREKCVVRTNACVETSALPERGNGRGAHRRAVCVGRLNRFKGVEVAIRAMCEAPEWELHVVGGGPDRRRLERLVERLGLGDRVTFTGRLSQEAAWRSMAEADALLLPSLKEGASFVAAEALTIGLPLVAFAVNGPPVLAALAPGRVALVPPDWPKRAVASFARALQRLDTSAPDRPSAAFGLSAVTRDLDSIYLAA
jgi:glycosyltransferase involved in cell wall biosynthesis